MSSAPPSTPGFLILSPELTPSFGSDTVLVYRCTTLNDSPSVLSGPVVLVGFRRDYFYTSTIDSGHSQHTLSQERHTPELNKEKSKISFDKESRVPVGGSQEEGGGCL